MGRNSHAAGCGSNSVGDGAMTGLAILTLFAVVVLTEVLLRAIK